MGLIRIFAVGNVGKEVEVKTLENGTEVANFSIAVTDKAFTKKDGTQVPEHTEWIDVVAWNGLAKLSSYINKGDKVSVMGRWRSHTYESEGVQKRSVNLIAEHIELPNKPKDAF